MRKDFEWPEDFNKIGVLNSMEKHLQKLVDLNLIKDFNIHKTVYGNIIVICFNDEEELRIVPDYDGSCKLKTDNAESLDLIDTEYFRKLNSGLDFDGMGYGRNE